jgi:hypothetical protein
MNMQTVEQSSELILKRINAIIAELQTLRQQVAIMQKRDYDRLTLDLVKPLYGSLGQGEKSG